MPVDEQTAALVALLRSGGRAWARYVVAARRAGGARAADPRVTLDEELGLLAYEALQQAAAELDGWQQRGIRVVTLRDEDYPANLAVIDARPPLVFIRGDLRQEDSRSVAVIGTRAPSNAGLDLTKAVVAELVAGGVTVVSGLATGIDAAAHRSAIEAGGRTLAVLGNGVDRVYPREHADLQELVASRGAVLSQFWPESEPSRQSFPARNAVMSGLALASVIVEASATSGTRIQARHAIEQGRSVVLMPPVLESDWAGELAIRAGVHVAVGPDDVMRILRV